MSDKIPKRAVQRITQAYDQGEDRIRLTVLVADGATLRLWLTQRLAIKLVRHIAGWLDDEVRHMGDAQKMAFLQAWEQSAAQVQFSGGEPVVDEVASEAGLLHSIDLSKGAGVYAITFKWGEGESVVLRLTAVELRQWMAILYRVYRFAKWPMAVWPQWFDPQHGGKSEQAAALH